MNKHTLLISLLILTTTNIYTANELNSPYKDSYLENLLEELSSLGALTPSPILLLPILSPPTQQQQKVRGTVSEDIVILPTPPPATSLSPKNSPTNQQKTKIPQRRPDSNPKAQKKSKRTSFCCTYPDCLLSKYDWGDKSKYNRHQLTHTDNKHFQCSLCKQTFSQKSSAVTHLAGSVHKGIVESAIRKDKKLTECGDVSKLINNRKFLAKFVTNTKEQE